MHKITNNELKWVGIDFDNTICNNTGFPEFVPTTVIDGFREALGQIVGMGLKPVIFTARTWAEYNIVEEWLRDNNLPVSKIICGKPLFRVMIDDKNIEFDGDWGKVIDKIK